MAGLENPSLCFSKAIVFPVLLIQPQCVPSQCALCSGKRSWWLQRACCVPPGTCPLMPWTTGRALSPFGRCPAPTNGGESCRANWPPCWGSLYPQVLGRSPSSRLEWEGSTAQADHNTTTLFWMEGVGCLLCGCVVTLVVHADVTGVEADVVLVLVALVLRHGEECGVLHL